MRAFIAKAQAATSAAAAVVSDAAFADATPTKASAKQVGNATPGKGDANETDQSLVGLDTSNLSREDLLKLLQKMKQQSSVLQDTNTQLVLNQQVHMEEIAKVKEEKANLPFIQQPGTASCN